MASPVVETADTATGSIGTSATSASVTYPANIASGDLLLFIGGTSSNVTVTLSGFTELGAGSNTCELHVWYKVADGTESGTVTWDFGGSSIVAAWAMLRITGADGTVERSSFSGSTASTINAPSLTVSWGAADNLFLGAGAYTDGNITMTAGAGNLNNDTNVYTSTTGPGVGIVFGDIASTSATHDPNSFSISSSTTRTACTIGVKAGAGVTPVNDSDTGSGADAGTTAAAVPVSDTGAGADAQTIAVAITQSDTGAGSETQSAGSPIAGSETGSGTDAGTVSVALTVTDTGSGAEAQSITVAVSGSDTSSGVDAGLVDIPIDDQDQVDSDSARWYELQHVNKLPGLTALSAHTGGGRNMVNRWEWESDLVSRMRRRG